MWTRAPSQEPDSRMWSSVDLGPGSGNARLSCRIRGSCLCGKKVSDTHLHSLWKWLEVLYAATRQPSRGSLLAVLHQHHRHLPQRRNPSRPVSAPCCIPAPSSSAFPKVPSSLRKKPGSDSCADSWKCMLASPSAGPGSGPGTCGEGDIALRGHPQPGLASPGAPQHPEMLVSGGE